MYDSMKKSAKVTLTVVAAVGLAACGRQRMDPCQQASFDQQACEDAVRSGGYYWNGGWVPMTYHYPYPYYYDSYRSYVSGGGHSQAVPTGAFAHPGASGVSRGGFGAIGAGHGAGE
jgi:hypothetical protein